MIIVSSGNMVNQDVVLGKTKIVHSIALDLPGPSQSYEDSIPL